MVAFDHALLEQLSLPGHRENLANAPLRAPWAPLVHRQLVSLGSPAHLTLEVIGFLGLEDLGCVPNIASNAFQPVQVVFIHILQGRNGER